MERKSNTILASLLQTCIDNKAYPSGKLLHAHILRTGLFFVDTFLSNRLIELYSKCGKTDCSRRVFDKMPHSDIYTWNAILGAYCKNMKLDDAHNWFVEMPERNTISWNIYVSSLARNGSEENALGFYSAMNREGFMPSHFTLASVFSVCGSLVDVDYGRGGHGVAIKIGLDKNMYVSNALLGMYAKCKRMEEAIKILGEMSEPNEVSFTAMMIGLAETEHVKEALEVFRLMCRTGIHIDAVSLLSVLGVCAKGGCGEFGIHDKNDGIWCNVHGQQVHCLTIKLGFETDLHLSNSLLDMYAKNGHMDSAELIFANLPEVSVVTWNVMIAGYGQNYQSGKAIEYMQRMQCSGFVPDEVTFINMLAACVKSGDIETAREIFKSMPCPSLSSWNSILSGYSKHENHKEAIKLFREMQFRSVQPDRTTLAIILSSCAEMGLLEGGKQVHAASLKAVFHTDIFVASGLIGMYSKCWWTEKAKCIFDRICVVDIVCWNSMIAGFSLNSLDNDAFILYTQMREYGMVPTEFTYATVLNSCAKLSLSQGRQVHAQIKKDGYLNDVFVGSSLIDMYCKCGDVDGAQMFFDTMPRKNTVSWNEMIHGYAQNGRGNEAVGLFEGMIDSGQEPDAITFVAVLTACSHSGLVDAGIKIFNSMQLNHGLEPLLDHYTCIIDSLSRAGRFDEVEVLIEKLPYKDDPIIWEVLLSSCRVHVNVSLARRAAEELFRLNPQNSSPYLLLANSFASMGEWDDARVVREMMSDKQVIKDPAYSWIESEDLKTADNKVEAFR